MQNYFVSIIYVETEIIMVIRIYPYRMSFSLCVCVTKLVFLQTQRETLGLRQFYHCWMVSRVLVNGKKAYLFLLEIINRTETPHIHNDFLKFICYLTALVTLLQILKPHLKL